MAITYKAAKSLQCKETPTHWNINAMFPQLSSPEIGEVVAVFFNSISEEYLPIGQPCPGNNDVERIEECLSKAKKLQEASKSSTWRYTAQAGSP